MDVIKKLEKLRQHMKSAGIDAYIITGSDPHGSEIPPSRWRTREWLSGFSGSAGTVIVTAEEAGLWTDFRYWIQASDELKDSGIDLFKENAEGVPEIQDWLASKLGKGSRVGVDGQTITYETSEKIEKRLSKSGIGFEADISFWDGIWDDRPELPSSPVVELNEDETGESRAGRITRLKESLAAEGADTWIGIALDSAAWLLNIRGGDVPYNPVVAGYVIVGSRGVHWYTDENKLPQSLKDSLNKDGILLAPYDDFSNGLNFIPGEAKVLADPKTLSRAVFDRLPDSVEKVKADDPVMMMKAVKNSVEAGHTARAMEKDGVAIVRFLKGLEEQMAAGDVLTEIEASHQLLEKRSAITGFLSESFSPIPAVGGHGAICHYEAKEEGVGKLSAGSGVFLIDSGGQWQEGTTDITRTVSLGKPSGEQKKDYTLVLKGHIALSVARFPKGTRGYQLDTLARMFLWQEGRDFGHGTGHGVGYRLNVHEGPQRISPYPIDVAMAPGMIVSNEPGLYRENEYGIRIENLLICREDESNEFGTFLAFDTLTLAPYDRHLIDINLLIDKEISWVDSYHSEVFKRLSPMLESDELVWLKAKTAALEL